MTDERNSNMTAKQLASYIQFTQIKPDLTRAELVDHAKLCIQYHFNAAMIAPCWVPLSREILNNSGVHVATFIDFGMGSASIGGKVALIKECCQLGADEVDYAPNMGFFLSGMYADFAQEAAEIKRASGKIPIKAMLQLGMIKNLDEKRHAIHLLEEAGVDWIKIQVAAGPLVLLKPRLRISV